MKFPVSYLDPLHRTYQQLETRYEADYGIMWYHMDPKPRPCFNLELLKELKKFVDSLPNFLERVKPQEENGSLRYTVFASKHRGVFNLGGDLEIILRMARDRNSEGLREYARACIEVVHSGMVNHYVPVTTISLVQGEAMGGGFEAALCNNVIIAEKSARFGFPEVLFNLFPGMGAHKLLARRLDPGSVERLISSGKIYGAAELHEMGLVDVLVEDKEGENAVYRFIREHSRRRNAYQSLLRVKNRIHPISYEELIEIADIWVDTAMQLGKRDLRLMERLLKAQDKMTGFSSAEDRAGQAEY
jgi:DSF synthase